MDPSLADVDGILPIHLAASHAHLGLCKVLLGKSVNEIFTAILLTITLIHCL